MAITIGRGRDRDEEKQRAGSQKDVVEKNRCKPTFVTTRRFRGRNRFHQFWHDFHEGIRQEEWSMAKIRNSERKTLYVMAGSSTRAERLDNETKRHRDEKRDEVTFRANANRS